MPRYDYVLFDADNTLFDFDRAEENALHVTLAQFGLPVTEEAKGAYLSVNRALWARFDRGEVTREWLVVERYAQLLRALGRPGDPAAMNHAYLTHLGEGAFLLPGAEALCRALAPRCTLAIVTNGVAMAQRARFARSPLRDVVPWLFISEEVGASKPSPDFSPRCSAHWGSQTAPGCSWWGTTCSPTSRAASWPGWTRPGSTPSICRAIRPFHPPGRRTISPPSRT